MRHRVVQDVSVVEAHGFGPRMTTWWGTLAFMALEGMGFVLAAGAYLYLAWLNIDWPLSADPPGLLWSGLFTLVLLLSLIPNELVKKRSLEQNNKKTRLLLVAMCVIGVLTLGIRAFEFTSLNIRWDTNAYGSLLWVLLGLHTTHLLTDVVDTFALTALFFTRHSPVKRFSDAEDNALYWSFVVLSWVPLYLLLYWLPRL